MNDKLKVLIVDDEYLLCEHIRRSIDWDKLGMEVAGMKRNGVEGLEFVRENHPDIVLADINMPEMDGLELAKALNMEFPEIHVLLVTGYGEFEYAQKAMRYGVDRYLLKPVDANLYTTEIMAVRDEIMRQRSNIDAKIDSALKSNRQNSTVTLPAFEDFCAHIGESDRLIQAYKALNADIGTGLFITIVFKWRLREDAPVSERDAAAVMNGGDDFKKNALADLESILFRTEKSELAAVAYLKSQSADDVIGALERYCADAEKRLGVCVYIGVSEPSGELGDISERYKQAKHAYESTYVLTDYKVISYHHSGEKVVCSPSQYFDAQQLKVLLRLNDIESIRKMIADAFTKMTSHVVSKENAVFTALMMVTILDEFLREISVDSREFDISELNAEISRHNSIQSLRDFTTMLFEKSLESVFYQASGNKSERVQKACRYIHANYSDKELSLKAVSVALYVNASYLSALFHKETGMTLVEYINCVRLKAAKNMLDKQPDIPVYEVADRTGYNNEYYFMRCFKKQYGISPKNYVNLKQQEELE